MKILHVLDHSLPLHSGYTFRSRSIFNAQRERGWQPVVVTSPKHEANWSAATSHYEVIDATPYYRSGACSTSRIPFVPELTMMIRTAKRVLAVARAEKPDLLHAHSPVLNALPTLWVGRKLGLPVVYEIRAFWEDAAVDHGTYREGSWKYRLTKAIEAWVCRRVDHVAILCNGLKNDLVSRGIPADKITPVFNGVSQKDFKATERDQQLLAQWGLVGKQVIGFIGSFYRYEGLSLLVDAFARLSETHPQAMLLLVGGGEVADELAAQVKNLGLDHRVIMPGRIDHNKVPDVYALLDVLVYPRLAMRLTELVTPLKPLEAMAMGKAVVASDVGGHRELIRHAENGMLFPAGDVSALAAQLAALIGDPEAVDSLGRRAAEWVVEKHSWRATTAAYEQIYSLEVGGRIKAEVLDEAI